MAIERDDKPPQAALADVDLDMLRALTDAGYMPLSEYLAEVERRNHARPPARKSLRSIRPSC